MALTVKVMRRDCINVSVNAEVFVKGEVDVQPALDKLATENVKVPQWKRLEVEDKGTSRQVVRIQEINMLKQGFVDHIHNQ